MLDREVQAAYELTVIAEDGGSPSKKTTTVVHITVIDVNDHTPEFRYPSPQGSLLNISCAELGNQIVAQIHANDSDSGKNGEVEYSLIRLSQNAQPRSRRRSEGSLMDQATAKSDGTTQNITVSSEQSPNLVSNNTPSPNKSNEKSPRHNKSAAPNTDNNNKDNNNPLLGGPSAEHFDIIDSYSGQLFLIHPIMDCSKPAEIRLLIQAKDGGLPAKSATTMLTIVVQPTRTNMAQLDKLGHAIGNNMKQEGGNTALNPKFISGHRNHPNARNPVKYPKQLPPPAPHGAPSNLSNSTHWSAIVGLIVAMAILVILLCMILVLLRRRLLMDDVKAPCGGKFASILRYTLPLTHENQSCQCHLVDILFGSINCLS